MAWVEQSGDKTWRVRYRRDDGTIGAVNGFARKTDATHHAETLESEQRHGTWIDPAAGKITVREWSTDWLDALDVAVRTEDFYRSLLTNHILPSWGDTGLADMSGIKVASWAKKLRASGYAPSTVSGITKFLSLLLADAVDERLIGANPIRMRRRGRHRPTRRVEQVWATPEETLAVADNAAQLPGAGSAAAMLMITAAWTGARWGELTGLQRPNLDLDAAILRIDPDIGTLHESSHGLELGPPKTAESARDVSLPPFLVDLLRVHLDSHHHRHVFVSAMGQLHRRSNFNRRAMRPAADGNLTQPRPPVHLEPVKPGLTFHGFRHSHKTWMIADNVPDIAQSLRLGHILDDKIQQTYSHVAAEVKARLLDALEARWRKAVANSTHTPAWRDLLG